MDIKQLIESGLLELYAMNALPAAEMKQISEWRTQYPELNEELKRIEQTLEQLAQQEGVTPSAGLKDKIASQLQFAVEEPEIKTVVMVPPFYKYAIAASVAIILVLSSTNLYFYQQYSETNRQLVALQSEKTLLVNQVNYVTTESEKIKNELAVITSPVNRQILLNGLPVSPSSKAVIYWNNETGSTYINSSALPQIAANEQFQLWAIVDGKPVDLGVIGKDTSFSEMKAVKNAQAFAITLEPLGGKPSPTLEKMYVLGNV